MEAEDCYQHVCNHVDQLDSQERRSWLHMYMGLYKHKIGENRIALEHIANANSTFREHEDLENPLFGYILLGHVHTALGALDKAQAEYDLALARRKNLIRQRWVYDLLAGMARLSLEYGHPAQSLSQVDEILTHLKTGNLDGTLEPIRVYLTCYQVLHANLDIRAAGILAGAYHMVMQRAENISDTKVRQSFLENVPMNREVIREYEKS